MKYEVNVVKKQVIELTSEDCEAITIATLKEDWYNHLHEFLENDDADAIKRVYNLYSGKNLV